jgi:hypothetical protein
MTKGHAYELFDEKHFTRSVHSSRGCAPKMYTYLSQGCMPKIRATGVDEATVWMLIAAKPFRAYAW